MPYYRAGDYYRGGDYYGRNYAAGGIFSGLGKVLGKVAKIGLGFTVGGPIGAIAAGLPGGGIARKLLTAGGPLVGAKVGVPAGLIRAGQALTFGGGFGGGQQAVAQLGPGPSPYGGGALLPQGPMLPGGFGGRRRMNVTNVHALRRAGRRVKGFLKLARRLGALPVGGSGKKLFKTKRRK